MKDGVKTTEFWLSLVAVVIGALATQYKDQPWAPVAGTIAASLAAAAYTQSRSSAKNGEQTRRAAEAELETKRVESQMAREDRAAKFAIGGGEEGRARVRTLVVIALIGLLCTGCLFDSPKKSYVEADQRTYDAIANEYLAYSAADPDKTVAQKENDKRVIRIWFLRIDAERKALLGDN